MQIPNNLSKIRVVPRTHALSKIELFVILAKFFHPLSNDTKSSISDVAVIVDPPMKNYNSTFIIKLIIIDEATIARSLS